MASTYTNLGVQLMATGEKAGTWGTLTNTNWNIIEQISGGYTTQALTSGGTVTLVKSDGSTGAVMATRVWKLTGALSDNAIVTVPDSIENWWIINNASTNAYTVQVKTVSGTGITWATTDKGTKILYTDGTNVIDATSSFGDVTLTGTQTLTSPKIGTSILDTNGNELALLTATGSAVNEITLANAATGNGPIISSTGETNVDLNLNPKGSGVLKSGTAAVKIAGKETMWVPATAMYAETTNGAELAQTVLSAGAPELKAFAFDASTAEAVQFNVSFPESWAFGTDVTFQTMWSASSTDTGTGGFTLAGCSVANNIDYDLAFGSAVANTALAASGTQDDLMINAESGGVTIASRAASTNTIFRLVRDTGTDTNTGDLRLVGVKIFFTTDAANDG